MQRRELGQRSELAFDLGVDPHRRAKPLAAVDDPVADGVGVAEPPVEGGPELDEALGAWEAAVETALA